jgi:hypothetical protein
VVSGVDEVFEAEEGKGQGLRFSWLAPSEAHRRMVCSLARKVAV